MKINMELTPSDLKKKADGVFELAAEKIHSVHDSYPIEKGAPVFTIDGNYTARGWTEWTQGFQFGMAILQYDATDDREFLTLGRDNTIRYMAPHVTHTGVHDHGFNNVSTYGNLRRLILEGRIDDDSGRERELYELALKCSGAVQVSRWTVIPSGGFIHSFNGPHSLFADTIRSLRAPALAHRLGHVLKGEQDATISLLDRLIQHAKTTAEYAVYYGDGRDAYDVRGRVAHESVFNPVNGSYRCPNSQQGYSPFSTWTRGLAWIMAGYAEQLEFIDTVPDDAFTAYGGREEVESMMLKAAAATCDFYIDNTAGDGIPYWDTGAPNLDKLGDYRQRPADPFNDYEPVDSSAAAIAVQGLLRLGRYLNLNGDAHAGDRYVQAGLTVLDALFDDPYLSRDSNHQGLILHSIYHRPNGWDHIPTGRKIPCGESSMWGDYHALEAALYVKRLADGGPYYTFFGPA